MLQGRCYRVSAAAPIQIVEQEQIFKCSGSGSVLPTQSHIAEREYGGHESGRSPTIISPHVAILRPHGIFCSIERDLE